MRHSSKARNSRSYLQGIHLKPGILEVIYKAFIHSKAFQKLPTMHSSKARNSRSYLQGIHLKPGILEEIYKAFIYSKAFQMLPTKHSSIARHSRSNLQGIHLMPGILEVTCKAFINADVAELSLIARRTATCKPVNLRHNNKFIRNNKKKQTGVHIQKLCWGKVKCNFLMWRMKPGPNLLSSQ